MFAIGVALQGKIYVPTPASRSTCSASPATSAPACSTSSPASLGWGQAPVLTAVADYGTKFIVVAGLLNIVAAVDAHSLANGRKRS